MRRTVSFQTRLQRVSGAGPPRSNGNHAVWRDVADRPRFLIEAKTFETIQIEGLIYLLTILNFPFYLLISSSLQCWTSEVFFQNATSFHCGVIAVGAQDELISLVIFSLYVNDMPSSSHYAELSLYVNDTTIIATSRKSVLFTS